MTFGDWFLMSSLATYTLLYMEDFLRFISLNKSLGRRPLGSNHYFK